MSHLLNYLPDLPLSRLGDSDEAGLCITSLPWPRAAGRELSLGGLPTYAQPIGQWPGEAAGVPRRLLLVGDSGGRAPEQLRLAEPNAGDGSLPEAAMVELARSPEPSFMWHRHWLRISWGGRSIGLLLGMRHAGEVRWWEACRLVEHSVSPTCRVIEMGGTIPRELCNLEYLAKHPGYDNPHLHYHNWLNGRLYLRLHANGICEVYARHINSRFFDDGRALDDVAPVIGLLGGSSQERQAVCGPWDGGQTELALGSARFDMAEAARLATVAQPGSIDIDNDIVTWQPYAGADIYGGVCLLDRTGDPYVCRADQHQFPRGLARTVRFSFSLSDRSPRIARYLAPAWWYGACEELLPAPLLPVSNEDDRHVDEARAWMRDYIVRGGFEDGAVPRHLKPQGVKAVEPGNDDTGIERHEPGWEGEAPYAQFLGAWRSGDADDYQCALRSAYHFTDVVIDHAMKLVRMHGFTPGAFAIPMARLQGTIAAYLETGDPYLIESAQATVEASYWLNKNSWPRLAVGRDACLVRSAVLLYRYFADDHFRRYALDTALMVAETQRENGSFGDQGGGTGLHAWGGYITKPWMGLLATSGLLDYLELFPNEERLLQTVRRFADWLLAERWEHAGGLTWSYQHDYNDERLHYDPYSATWGELPTPYRWHEETIGRLMLFCAERFQQPAYYEAWAISHALEPGGYTDHKANATLQFLPWVQAKLWNAEITPDGLQLRPHHYGPSTPENAEILGPDGAIPVNWADGRVQVPAEVATVVSS